MLDSEHTVVTICNISDFFLNMANCKGFLYRFSTLNVTDKQVKVWHAATIATIGKLL